MKVNVRMKKEMKLVIIFVVCFALLNVIGYCFQIEILKTILINSNNFEFGFVPIISSIIVTFICGLFIRKDNF